MSLPSTLCLSSRSTDYEFKGHGINGSHQSPLVGDTGCFDLTLFCLDKNGPACYPGPVLPPDGSQILLDITHKLALLFYANKNFLNFEKTVYEIPIAKRLDL